MITNHKLLIDKNCPMCSIYGNCFTKWGLVDRQTIVFYQTVNRKIFDQIDEERAKSEVALVHPRSGKTAYGIDAFLQILSNNRPILKRLFEVRWIYFLLQKLYRFISFNRKVIVGKIAQINERDCTPSVHIPYRIAYLLIAALFTGFMVNQFALALDSALQVDHHSWREYAICFGQIGWQFLFLGFVDSKKRLDYLGNMSTVSLIGALLLIPLLVLNLLFSFNPIVLIIGFMAIVGFMFHQHIRRCKQIGLPISVSLSWVLFRTTVLILILVLI